MHSPEKDPQASPFFPQGECMQELCDGQLRTPGQAYALYAANRDARHLPWPEYYFSTTITSGGFLRQEGVDFAEGMQANHDLAKSLVNDAVSNFQLDSEAVVLPSDLGKVAGWGQAEYLIFWYHLIHGARPEDTVVLDPYFQTDNFKHLAMVMEDKLLPRELRKQAYFELYKYVVTVAQSTEEGISYDVNWVKRPKVVPLVDVDYSLGCIGENWWSSNPLQLKIGQVRVSEGTSRSVRAVQLLGASVMGDRYDREQAQLWADYFRADLKETI